MEKHNIKCPHHDTLQCLELECERLEKFYLAIDGTSEQVTITNPLGTIIYANKATHALTGYSQEEILGKTPDLWAKKVCNRQSDDCSNSYHQVFQIIRENNCCFFGEVENINKAGEKYFTDVRITSITDDQNKARFFVITERDVTASKKLDQSKLEFLSISSHELRTPLASISLASELLLRGNQEDAQNQKFLIEEIHLNTKKMAQLISTYMNLARIEMGTLKVNPEPINAKNEIEKILAELAILIQNKKIILQTEFDPEILFINYDKKFFTVIFDNLISNAIKYTPEGGQIRIQTKRNDNHLEIIIQDTGIGIDEEDIKQLFKKQFRTKNAIKEHHEGDGLGLYIVKALIDKTNSKINVESQLNQGTAFKISIPVNKSA